MIKPYYEDESGVIYHGDCLEILPELPDKSVDLVLTDPPYGVDVASLSKDGVGGEQAKKRYESGCYDDRPITLKSIIKRILPLMLGLSDCVAVCAGIKTLMLYPQPDWILAWIYKKKHSFCPYGFNNWTPILCYGKDPFQQKRKGNAPFAVKTDVIYDNSVVSKNGHPTPKPVSFVKKLIERLSTERGELILDPFLGSGTTAVAAKKMGCRYIGIEIEEKYCEIAANRLRQKVMF